MQRILFFFGISMFILTYLIGALCSWNWNPVEWNIVSYVLSLIGTLIVASGIYANTNYGQTRMFLRSVGGFENHYQELLSNFDRKLSGHKDKTSAFYDFSNDLYFGRLHFEQKNPETLSIFIFIHHYVFGTVYKTIKFSSTEDQIVMKLEVDKILLDALYNEAFYKDALEKSPDYSLCKYDSDTLMAMKYGYEKIQKMDEWDEIKKENAIQILKENGVL